MRKYTLLLIIFLLVHATAQEVIRIHNSDNIMFESPITEVESIMLKNNTSVFSLADNSLNIPVSEIDSITFASVNADANNIVYIIFGDGDVTVINPMADKGVSVTANIQHVIVSSTTQDNVEYHISGETGNGSVFFTSASPLHIKLSNASITNPSGAAVYVQNGIAATILVTGNNNLTDGTNSTQNAPLLTKGSFTFEGTGILTVMGYKKHAIAADGNITVNNSAITIPAAVTDGFHSEGFVMNGGNLSIQASGDAIDAGAAVVEINNGQIAITSLTDDAKGLKTDATLTINGGIINMTLTGAQSKGISSKENVVFNGGTTNITTSGATVLTALNSGYDASYCSAVKTKGNIIVNNGNINIESKSTNDGGKGLSADGNINIYNGNIIISTAGNGAVYVNDSGATDSYATCCIKADTDINILGGNVQCTSTGSGGKGVSADGILVIGSENASNDNLHLTVTTSGERFYVSGSTGGGRPGQESSADYSNPKAVKSEGNMTINSGTLNITCSQSNEGGEGLESKNSLTINGGIINVKSYDDCINASSHIQINGGTVYCVSSGNDAIDSNGTLSITGGMVMANGTKSPEAGFDCDNNQFTITGGIIIGTGGSTSSPTTNACTQRSIKYTATAGNAICIKNSSGEIILMYQLPTFSSSGGNTGPGGGGNSMVVLLSHPSFSTGSYTIHYGGTISGGNFVNGYNTGGTYSGGSSKSFTISSMVTSI